MDLQRGDKYYKVQSINRQKNTDEHHIAEVCPKMDPRKTP